MPIAILKFHLPEEKEDYELAMKGSDYYLALCAIREALRSVRKYGTDTKEIEKAAGIERLFWNIIQESGIDL